MVMEFVKFMRVKVKLLILIANSCKNSMLYSMSGITHV